MNINVVYGYITQYRIISHSKQLCTEQTCEYGYTVQILVRAATPDTEGYILRIGLPLQVLTAQTQLNLFFL